VRVRSLAGDDPISESGEPVEYAEGVKVLSVDEGEVVLAVRSGRYEFAGRVAS
jgi:hypothetical protein